MNSILRDVNETNYSDEIGSCLRTRTAEPAIIHLQMLDEVLPQRWSEALGEVPDPRHTARDPYKAGSRKTCCSVIVSRSVVAGRSREGAVVGIPACACDNPPQLLWPCLAYDKVVTAPASFSIPPKGSISGCPGDLTWDKTADDAR